MNADFELHILGCGASLPRPNRGNTSQFLQFGKTGILIDCGEGTQMKLRRKKIKMQKIEHIFISHLHGDHYFGLIGLLSTISLLGRKKPLNIYAPEPLEDLILNQFKATKTYLSYHLEFHNLSYNSSQIILENDEVVVSTIPLKHSVYCNGFLFSQTPRRPTLNIKQVKRHDIPIFLYENIKRGLDVELENGTIIENEKLVFPPKRSVSYAYCSDTMYNESIVPIIKNVDVLYHETTFLSSEKQKAKQTCHSTVEQACEIANKAGVKYLLMGHYSARYNDLTEFETQAKLSFENAFAVRDLDEFSYDNDLKLKRYEKA